MIRRRWVLVERSAVDGRVLSGEPRDVFWTAGRARRVAAYRNRIYDVTGVRRYWTPTKR